MSVEREYAAETLSELFARRAERRLNFPGTYTKENGRWTAHTWREARTAVENTASALLEMGVERGDRIAIISSTRREWSQLDMAIMYVGAITVGVYPTLTPEQTSYLLFHSESRLVFVEDESQLAKVEGRPQDEGEGPAIVCLTALENRNDVETLEAFTQRGEARRKSLPDEVENRRKQSKASDVVTYVYTSGTTGEPKAAMLTHSNFHYVIHATIESMSYDHEIALTFLPLAHSLQRYANYLGLVADVEGYYAESLENVAANIAEVRPSCFATVPRILEKIHSKVVSAASEAGGIKALIFSRSLKVLLEIAAKKRAGQRIGLPLKLKARIADQMVAKKIRNRLGGRVNWLGCGGAPLLKEVHEFFEAMGIPILEGYGLTETSAPVSLNTLTARKIGTVGKPLAGTEVMIDETGEILVRGPGVFVGYYKNKDATDAVFTEDGWFRTGDVGRFDEDGFLLITDRIKDLIITAGGKNIAPQPIESQLKAVELIGQAVVIGDSRPYLCALIGVDPDALAPLAERLGMTDDDAMTAMNESAALRDLIQEHVDRVNANLPKFEQIKRWAFLPEEMTIESGALTPTLKVKRRVIHERYSELVDDLYRSK
jgi:long-chain acyl-CoA synthetase